MQKCCLIIGLLSLSIFPVHGMRLSPTKKLIAAAAGLALPVGRGLVTNKSDETIYVPDQKVVYPQVIKLKWGEIVVYQKGSTEQVYKDCKLFPVGSSEWNWNKTGTRHVPGVQVADLEEFVDDVEVVILSEGVDGVLQVKPETIEFLTLKKKEYHLLRTPAAVELYNKLVLEGKLVGALIHTTC